MDEEKVKEFVKAYEELCKEHNLQIAYRPEWKQSQDTGTFSLVILPFVTELKPN
jgi:flagellar capping protein FliD